MLTLIALVPVMLGIVGCSEDSPTEPGDNRVTAPVMLRFVPMFGDEPLVKGKSYTTAAGEEVSFSDVKFYCSEVALVDTLGGRKPMEGLHLVDCLDAETEAKGYVDLEFQGEVGTSRGLTFTVGVPFDLNHRDAATQEMPLGPNSGMYWSWNPGYIFHKIDGTVDSAGTALSLVYHIGGDSRRVSPLLGVLAGPDATTFEITETGENLFVVTVDYAKLFRVGLDPARPMQPGMVPAERFHHFGPKALADRTTANTVELFSLGQ